MSADRHIRMVDVTLAYFESLGDFYHDPFGAAAVGQVRDQMIQDLTEFESEPSETELAELCRRWRKLRIEPEGEPTYPPNMFIESVCQVIALS